MFTLAMLGIYALFLLFSGTLAIDSELTVDVGPGKQECFYETIKKETELEIEYQVIDGGDLDISFSVQDPNNRMLIRERKKTENMHKVDCKIPGDYRICFDNTFSHFSSKLVFFELVSDDGEESEETDWTGAQEELQEIIDMQLAGFRTIIETVKNNLDKTMDHQSSLRNVEFRDRRIAEANFTRVNTFSIILLVVMITTGLVQVILIRHLFDDSSRVKGQHIKVQT